MPKREPIPSAIPTTYSGINMRSRLEARWGIMFDLLGWRWEYEPALNLAGYIPDFLVYVELERASHERAQAGPLIFETKPITATADYRDPIMKIALSGWSGGAVVVGSSIETAHAGSWFGMATARVERADALPGACAWRHIGLSDDARGLQWFGGPDPMELWRTAGNRSQWQPAAARGKAKGIPGVLAQLRGEEDDGEV